MCFMGPTLTLVKEKMQIGKTLSLKAETNQKPKYLGSDWYKGEFKEIFSGGPHSPYLPTYRTRAIQENALWTAERTQ